MDSKKRKFLSDEDVQRLLSYIRSRADSARKRGTSRVIIDELIIHLLLEAGLRPNELCGLRIEDLPVIHGENAIWIRNGNENAIRKISITQDLEKLLTRFVTLYRKQAPRKDPLLQSERGNPFSYISLYCKVRRIGLESGIKDLSPAVLRRTYVKHLYDTEQDLRYVQEQTGYASCRTVANYIKSDNIAMSTQSVQTCDACGINIPAGSSRKIESGQLLCQDCLKYFPQSQSNTH